jgi:hypothetical protein
MRSSNQRRRGLRFCSASSISPYWIAIAYIRLGEIDAAFKWLERANEKKDPMLGSLMVEPMLDPIRSDPRYTELLRNADLIR